MSSQNTPIICNGMTIGEARSYIGSEVNLTWLDRKGEEHTDVAFVEKADFIPLYGPCLLTDVGEIRLDRIVSCTARSKADAA